jgi:flagellar hook assembly protein FlgD
VEPGPVVALRLGPPQPNPSAAGTRLQLELPAPARVRFDVLDVAGRVVRSRDLGQLAAGSHPLEWDGLDARGSHVSAGLYWVRVRAGTSDALQRIVRLN